MKQALVLTTMITTGCMSTSPQRESLWKELDQVQEVTCSPWPVEDEDLAVINVEPMKSQNRVAFWSTTKTREGYDRNKIHVFSDGQLFETETNQYEVDADSFLVGGGFAGEGGYWGVIGPSASEEDNHLSTLMFNQFVGPQKSIAPLNLDSWNEDSKVLPVEGGFWLRIRKEKGFELHFVNSNEKDVKNFPKHFLPIKSEPYVGSMDDKNFFTLYLDKKTSLSAEKQTQTLEPTLHELPADGSKVGKEKMFDAEQVDANANEPEFSDLSEDMGTSMAFYYSPLNKPDTKQLLEIPTNLGVESYDVKPFKGGFKLAYIEGDSLVGQGVLRVAYFVEAEGAVAKKWEKSFPLEDTHASDLVWVSGKNGEDQLLFLKWLDAERTLASYQVTDTDVIAMKNVGLFAKDSALIDGFSVGPKGASYAVMRYKWKRFWKFELCNLSET